MGFLKVTNEDLKAVEQPAEGWHPLQIVKFETELSKKGDSSKVHHVTLKVIAGDDKGKGTKDFFSEKLIGMMGELLEAAGIEKDSQGNFMVEDTDALVGRKVEGRIEYGMYNGRKTAKPASYRPFNADNWA